MARVLGESGRYVHDEAQRKRWQALRLVIILLLPVTAVEGFILATLVPFPHLPQWSRLTILLALGILAVAIYRYGTRRVRLLDKQRDDLDRGAAGESIVGRRLADFPNDFHVINDLATPFGNVDHVVVGPTGVFFLDTKAWRGTVAPDGKGELLLNGRPTDKRFVSQFGARMLAIRDKVRLLAPQYDPFYQAVFVFTSARVDAKWGTTSHVHCMRDEQLHDYIVAKNFGRRLPPAEVEALARAFLGLAHMEPGFTDRMTTAPGKPAPAPPTPPQSRNAPLSRRRQAQPKPPIPDVLV